MKGLALLFICGSLLNIQQFDSMANSNIGLYHIDSLSAKLHEDIEDSVKINILIELQHRMQYYDIDKSSQYGVQLVKLSNRLNHSKGKVGALLNEAHYYLLKNNYGKSIDSYFSAIQLMKQLNYLKPMSSTLNNIGNVYARIEDWDKAITYFQKSKDLALETNNQKIHSVGLTNLASCYSTQKKYALAITHYLEALSLEGEQNDRFSLALIYSNLGHLYFKVGLPEKAAIFLHKGKKYYEHFEKTDSLNWELNSLLTTNRNDLGNYYFSEEKLDSAKYYFQKAIKTATRSNILDDMAKGYRGMYQVFFHEKDFEQALANFKMYTELKDSIQVNENIRNVHAVELKMQYEKEQLKKQNSISKKKNTWMFIALLLVSGLAILQTIIITQRKKLLKHMKQKSAMENKFTSLKSEISDKELEIAHKAKSLTDVSLLIKQRGDLIQFLLEELRILKKQNNETERQKILNSLIVRLNSLTETQVKQTIVIEQNHRNFVEKLRTKYPTLNKSELQLALLIKTDTSNKEIASMFNIHTKSVNMKRYRLRKKIGISHDTDLYDFLNSL
ncbi:MAG: tetratricopeptide repeat protein [Salinivirgaceae bacterium]